MLESTKPGVNVTVISLESDLDQDLKDELGVLADEALPAEFCNEVLSRFRHFSAKYLLTIF